MAGANLDAGEEKEVGTQIGTIKCPDDGKINGFVNLGDEASPNRKASEVGNGNFDPKKVRRRDEQIRRYEENMASCGELLNERAEKNPRKAMKRKAFHLQKDGNDRDKLYEHSCSTNGQYRDIATLAKREESNGSASASPGPSVNNSGVQTQENNIQNLQQNENLSIPLHLENSKRDSEVEGRERREKHHQREELISKGKLATADGHQLSMQAEAIGDRHVAGAERSERRLLRTKGITSEALPCTVRGFEAKTKAEFVAQKKGTKDGNGDKTTDCSGKICHHYANVDSNSDLGRDGKATEAGMPTKEDKKAKTYDKKISTTRSRALGEAMSSKDSSIEGVVKVSTVKQRVHCSISEQWRPRIEEARARLREAIDAEEKEEKLGTDKKGIILNENGSGAGDANDVFGDNVRNYRDGGRRTLDPSAQQRYSPAVAKQQTHTSCPNLIERGSSRQSSPLPDSFLGKPRRRIAGDRSGRQLQVPARETLINTPAWPGKAKIVRLKGNAGKFESKIEERDLGANNDANLKSQLWVVLEVEPSTGICSIAPLYPSGVFMRGINAGRTRYKVISSKKPRDIAITDCEVLASRSVSHASSLQDKTWALLQSDITKSS